MGAPLCAAQHKDEHEAQTGMHAGMNTHASRVLFHTISAGPMGCSTGITPHEAINTVAAAAIAMAMEAATTHSQWFSRARALAKQNPWHRQHVECAQVVSRATEEIASLQAW
jgi:hypothetical protein